MEEDLQNILGKFSANQDHTLSIWASKDPIVVQQVTQFGEVYRTKFCLKLQNYQKYDSSLLVGAVAYLVQCLAQCGQTCKENLDRGVYFRDGWSGNGEGGGDTGTERTLSEANCSKKVSSVSGISADIFFLHGA